MNSNVKSIIKGVQQDLYNTENTFELFSSHLKPNTDTKSFNKKNEGITQSDVLSEVFGKFKMEIVTKAGEFL